MEEGHENHFPKEREPRTWDDPIRSHLCGTREAPSCVRARRQRSGGEGEHITTGCPHREDPQPHHLGWKEPQNPSEGHRPTGLRDGDSRRRYAHVQRSHEERKPQNQVRRQVPIKPHSTAEIRSEAGARWGLISDHTD